MWLGCASLGLRILVGVRGRDKGVWASRLTSIHSHSIMPRVPRSSDDIPPRTHLLQDYHGLIQKLRFYSAPTLEFVSPKDATHCVWMGDLGYRLNFNMNPKDRQKGDRGDGGGRRSGGGSSRSRSRRKRSGGGGGGEEEDDEGMGDELRLCHSLIEDKDWKGLQERDQLLAAMEVGEAWDGFAEAGSTQLPSNVQVRGRDDLLRYHQQ